MNGGSILAFLRTNKVKISGSKDTNYAHNTSQQGNERAEITLSDSPWRLHLYRKYLFS